MSVYTQVSQPQLENFLSDFSAGKLLKFEGIGAGIENTNYFVSTDQGEYVLTLFEQMEAEEAAYYLDLMAFLADQGIPCAHPLADHQGQYLKSLCNRPATLVQRLSGHHIESPDEMHCFHIGEALAKLHIAGNNYPKPKPNNRGKTWWDAIVIVLEKKLSKHTLEKIKNEIRFQIDEQPKELPQGIIHADLFRDNALFDKHRVSGLIDFYYACYDILILDIAVTANDWCTDNDGQLIAEKIEALLKGYQIHRPLSDEEKKAWPTVLRAAALRFWLSRLYDQLFPRDGHLTHTKDPKYFEKILHHHQQHQPDLIIA